MSLRFSGIVWFVACVLCLACSTATLAQGRGKKWVAPPPLDPARAMKNLEEICKLGPRVSGSQAMERQWELLTKYFEALGGKVELQEFRARNPETGQPVTMKNLIVRYFPENPKRLLLCAHYDTRPFPDRDLKNPKGLFLGANDGASGVAFMQEMAHALQKLDCKVGVDLVLFDGEELIYNENRDQNLYFVGSTYFAQDYVDKKDRGYSYYAGILVDMIGDADLQLFYEENSYQFNKELVREIWQIAEKLRIDAFIPRKKTNVRDDHLPLNRIGGIPTIDIIDFDYPQTNPRGPKYWHTTQDVPAKCSGESICKVATVILEWLKRQE